MSQNISEKSNFRQFLESSAVPGFIINRNHTIICWNPACAELTGFAPEEMVGTGKQWLPFYDDERPVLADLIVDNSPEKEILRHYDNKCRKLSLEFGTYQIEDYFPEMGENGRWLSFTASPIKNQNGEMIAAVETFQDITLRKEAEDKLRLSENRYRKLFEKMKDGVVVLKPVNNGEEFIVTEINHAAGRIIKCDPSNAVGKKIREILPQAEEFGLYESTRKVYRTRNPILTDITSYRDEYLALTAESQIYALPEGEIVVIFRDVTKNIKYKRELESYRNQLEELVEIRNANLGAIFRSVEEGIITVDLNRRILEVNQAAGHFCGISPEKVRGMAINDIEMDCDRSCLKVLDETIRSGKNIREFRIECHSKKRESRLMELTSAPLTGKNGEFMGAVLVSRDITRLNLLEQKLKARRNYHGIIGGHNRMQEIYRLLDNLAKTDTNVLIAGETGTGKGLVARTLHETGPRAFMPMVEVNCSALAENLLESELFGHVKGSFTGAIKDKVGKFVIADGGTILLDEIGDVPLKVQLKLLQVLQDKIIVRVGDTEPIKTDIRIIAATNRDLRKLVREGLFREDLYYRLKVMEIEMPPLRNRDEDIELLIFHYLKEYSNKFNKNIDAVSGDALEKLRNYSWPGNIRELKHALEHACLLTGGSTILVEHLPREIGQSGSHRIDQGEHRNHNRLADILNECGGNKSLAARKLGISRPTLYRRIKESNIKLS